MSEALVPGETIDWPTFGRFKIEPGDLVYFYASSPVLQMIGKCEIERNDLPFAEADPRNDLRRRPVGGFSRFPWMRMRVLQVAPVPFKPLQRSSLYYHTEFKPSPYPKLLHDSERDYVNRAFDEAMTYRADLVRNPGGRDPQALDRVERGHLLDEALSRLTGARIESLSFGNAGETLRLTLAKGTSERLTLQFGGVRRLRWDFDASDSVLAGMRLSLEDIFLLTNLDGLDAEILSDTLTVDPSE